MKLIVAIVQREDTADLIDALVEKGYRATRIDTAGGFLKSGNTTLMIGVEDHQVEDVFGIITDHCKRRTVQVNPVVSSVMPGQFYVPFSMEVEVGGATLFVLPVERFERV
ncbi:MAG: cyclic-di-AMP receptor [Chloroflexota bacterium]|jgi:uncharacterized protein YaaQ